jgi:DNA-binding NtrC family response regulator
LGSGEGEAAQSTGAGYSEHNAPVARRVLLIDDELPIRRALSRYLTRRGWSVDTAGDATEALEFVRPAPLNGYDAIITDLAMPGLTGAEFHDLLREERPDLFPRLVIATGDSTSAEAMELRSRSTCMFMEKPFELAALVRVLESLRGG